MKTFSQLKRDLQKGVKIRTILNNLKPEFNGEIRTIKTVQTNAVSFECVRNGRETESWLWWGKAANYEYEGNIFKVYDNPMEHNNFKRELLFEYEIMEA